MGSLGFDVGRIGRAAALAGVGVVLTGCSGGITSSLPSLGGAVPSWFASTREPLPPTPAGAPDPTLGEDCPGVEVRTGASTLAVTAKTQQATANDLRYQLSFTQTARECRLLGQTVRMRVGVQGRVVVGPAGVSGEVDVPVRYAVVREGVTPRTITTKFRRVLATVPPGATNVTFTDIEEDLSFPMPARGELDAYVVYVGFDDIGERTERKPAAAKKSTPRAQ